jgi:hypothetical protein
MTLTDDDRQTIRDFLLGLLAVTAIAVIWSFGGRILGYLSRFFR